MSGARRNLRRSVIPLVLARPLHAGIVPGFESVLKVAIIDAFCAGRLSQEHTTRLIRAFDLGAA